ncbi:MAG: hypothetical protein Q7T16_03355 [Candidatus Burarchaeum sp.]|nr:hypothetical protein [Candidatus Burarchaeum sp.]MDO8339669.1 hypothetical protein [Candidatus Burarchaeum sp.]
MAMRRGQAIIDYLLSHAWALIALSMIFVILVWLGVFRGGTSETCFSGDGALFCYDLKAAKSDVQLTLYNNKPDAISVCDIICDSRLPGNASRLPPNAPDYSNCASTGIKISSGSSAEISATSNSMGRPFCTHDGKTPLSVGEQYRGPLYIIFSEQQEGDYGSPRVSVGEIAATVQP